MTRTAVATEFGGPDVLSVIDAPAARPGPGQVVVDVRAAGMNPVDLKISRGDFGADISTLPKRLGFEVSGVVSAVGTDAQGPAGPLSVGDEVIAYPVEGGYADQVVASSGDVHPKPSQLSFEQASGLMLTGVTAVHLVKATGVADGDTVLLHGGAGGVGLMALQLAVGRGARVIATAREGRHGALRELGAEPVAYGEGLAGRVRALAPDGVDVALDTVGTDEAVDVSVELVADRSRIATIAAFSRAPELGIQLLGMGPNADPGTAIRAAARGELLDLVRDGRLTVHVAATYPLADVRVALAQVATGHALGKVVLVP